MKLLASVRNLRQRRAHKRYERDKAERDEQGEHAMDRVKDAAGYFTGPTAGGA